jgi:hypothetical protein
MQDTPSAAAHRTQDLVRQAILAPSSHNTQPWIFRVRAESVELYADRTRALPVNDPLDRELTISSAWAIRRATCRKRRAGRLPR